jgi:hypothetical protein
VETLLTFKQFPQADVVKGKQVIDISGEMQKREKKSSLLQITEKWRPPSLERQSNHVKPCRRDHVLRMQITKGLCIFPGSRTISL